ncbi:MAG: hypothetical protein R2865_08980 [Deinococcales bacterium]
MQKLSQAFKRCGYLSFSQQARAAEGELAIEELLEMPASMRRFGQLNNPH